MKKSTAFMGLLLFTVTGFAQVDSIQEYRKIADSLYIEEVQSDKKGKDKVLHAEPLFIDLIRDLGARKGEKEWNIGLGLNDNNKYDLYTALIEYEFAPVNRLGLEVELPFSFYYPVNVVQRDSVPSSKLNSFKMAMQYSFFVSEKLKTSLAAGYIHELELKEFNTYGKKNIFKGHLYNPFVVAAKRWGTNFHSMVYAGPQIFVPKGEKAAPTNWQVNTSMHYMISGTRNFVGLEINKEIENRNLNTVMRPQMRVGLAENLLVGIVSGIPLQRNNQRFSTFIRLIYEPGHRLHAKPKYYKV
jgi:hypothetical protein